MYDIHESDDDDGQFGDVDDGSGYDDGDSDDDYEEDDGVDSVADNDYHGVVDIDDDDE